MKIKFTSPVMAAFTGMFGSIEFLDGVSVNAVSANDVRLYRAIESIEVIGNDETDNRTYDDIKDIEAISSNLPTLADLQRMEAEANPAPAEAPQAAPGVIYTQAQLEAIADEKGIQGIRDIAEPMDIRGTSISKLIQAILASQAVGSALAGFIEAPAEAVTVAVTMDVAE